jgi:hypothetical protein
VGRSSSADTSCLSASLILPVLVFDLDAEILRDLCIAEKCLGPNILLVYGLIGAGSPLILLIGMLSNPIDTRTGAPIGASAIRSNYRDVINRGQLGYILRLYE